MDSELSYSYHSSAWPVRHLETAYTAYRVVSCVVATKCFMAQTKGGKEWSGSVPSKVSFGSLADNGNP